MADFVFGNIVVGPAPAVPAAPFGFNAAAIAAAAIAAAAPATDVDIAAAVAAYPFGVGANVAAAAYLGFGGFGGFGAPIMHSATGPVSLELAKRIAYREIMTGHVGEPQSANALLYRSPMIITNINNYYIVAKEDITSLSTNLTSVHNALKVLCLMRSDNPNYDTIACEMTSRITMPEIDDLIRIATSIKTAVHKNGAELISRRESYLASLRYKAEFDISNISALPREVQLVICEFLGTDIAITSTALLCVRDINIAQFCNVIIKKN